MQYFTSAWHRGELSERECDRALQRYRRHVESLLPSLAPPLRRLVTLSLHDGLIERVVVGPHDLALSLRVGDRQVGYKSLTLAYRGVARSGSYVARLRRATTLGAELLSDELDRTQVGLVHRLFFSPPDLEVAIHFKELALGEQPRASRRIRVPVENRVVVGQSGAA